MGSESGASCGWSDALFLGDGLRVALREERAPRPRRRRRVRAAVPRDREGSGKEEKRLGRVSVEQRRVLAWPHDVVEHAHARVDGERAGGLDVVLGGAGRRR